MVMFAAECRRNRFLSGRSSRCRMLILFSNGEQRLFDATILNGPAFEPLQNLRVFMAPELDHGVVTWAGGELDCAPEYMYENSYAYSLAV